MLYVKKRSCSPQMIFLKRFKIFFMNWVRVKMTVSYHNFLDSLWYSTNPSCEYSIFNSYVIFYLHQSSPSMNLWMIVKKGTMFILKTKFNDFLIITYGMNLIIMNYDITSIVSLMIQQLMFLTMNYDMIYASH